MGSPVTDPSHATSALSVSLSASPMKRALQIHTCLQPGIATRGCALLLLSFPLTHEGLMSFGEGEKRN